MKWRRPAALALMLAGILVLFSPMAGCSKPEEKIKVTIWHSSGEQQNEALEDIVARFNESHDNIQVVAESQPSTDFMNNVYNAVANGVGPDIIFNYASTVSDYLADGKVVNLGKYFDLEELSSIVPQAVFDECTSFGDGNLYCLPLHSSGPVLFYNKTIFEEVGCSVPTSWDELADISETIYREKGIPGFGADSLTDLMQCLILQSGFGYIDEENKCILFNHASTVSALEWFGENVRSGYFTNEKDGNYFYNNLNAGLLASCIASCGCEEYITLDDYGVAPIPQSGEVEWCPTWNRALILFTSNEERETAAAEFLKFFTNAENSAQWCMASGNISPYSYALDVDDYTAFLSENKALAVVNESKEHSSMLPTIVGSSTVRFEVERMAVLAIDASSSIPDVLNDVEQRCNEALKQK